MRKTQTRKAKQAGSSSGELFKALSHDLRVEILTILSDRGKASPAEMAKAIGAPVPDVTYHVKQLVEYGCAELAGEQKTKGKGSIEHFYRAVARPILDEEEWEQMAPAARDGFSRQIIRNILRDLEYSLEGGTLDKRTDRHMTRVPLDLDEEGWQRVQEIQLRAYEEILDEHAKSAGRRAESGEQAIRASSVQLCFEVPSS